MGTTATASSALGRALFSPVQRRLFGLLFGQPERRFQSAELIRLVGSGTGAVHRQLQELSASGLVTAERLGNQKYYQADPRSPIYQELRGIVLKTVGLVGPLREALGPLSAQLDAAFVYGSIASGTDRAASDIDLMIHSDTLTYADIFEAVQPAERALARKVNPTVMSRIEWRRKQGEPGSFVARVGAGPMLFVVGNADDLA